MTNSKPCIYTPEVFSASLPLKNGWFEADPFLLGWYIFRGYAKLPGSIVHVCPFVKVVGLHTLLAKAVGIVFSVSAGLPCGKAWDLGKKWKGFAPVNMENLPVLTGFYRSQVVGNGISAINSRALKNLKKILSYR